MGGFWKQRKTRLYKGVILWGLWYLVRIQAVLGESLVFCDHFQQCIWKCFRHSYLSGLPLNREEPTCDSFCFFEKCSNLSLTLSLHYWCYSDLRGWFFCYHPLVRRWSYQHSPSTDFRSCPAQECTKGVSLHSNLSSTSGFNSLDCMLSACFCGHPQKQSVRVSLVQKLSPLLVYVRKRTMYYLQLLFVSDLY